MTYRELLNKLNEMAVIDTNIKDKLSLAICRFGALNKKVLEDYDEELMLIKQEEAATNKDGVILLSDDGNNFRFTKEGLNNFNARKKELNEKVIKITPYYCVDHKRIKELDLYIIDSLNGLLFNVDIEELIDESEAILN